MSKQAIIAALWLVSCSSGVGGPLNGSGEDATETQPDGSGLGVAERPEVLGRIEAECRCVSDASDSPALVPGAVCLGCIFDHH